MWETFLANWLFLKGVFDPVLSLPFLGPEVFSPGAIVYRLVIRRVIKGKDVIVASMGATFWVSALENRNERERGMMPYEGRKGIGELRQRRENMRV